MALQESSKPLHSLYIDFSFKLNHLSRADVVGDVWERGSRVPPFSRFFIQDGEVLRHLREPVATTSVDETPHVCSDFKADEVQSYDKHLNRWMAFACHL